MSSVNHKGLHQGWIYFHYTPSITIIILCLIFLMYVATIKCLNYRGQESKTRNLKFIFLTDLWPWNKIKVIEPSLTTYLSKLIIMQSLKALALMVAEKKPTLKVLSNEEICQLSPLNMCPHQKRWYIHDLFGLLNNLGSFNLIGWEHNILS